MSLKKAKIILAILTLVIAIVFIVLYDLRKNKQQEKIVNDMSTTEKIQKETLTPEEKKELMLEILERGTNESEEEKEQKKQEMLQVLEKNNNETMPKNEQELAQDSKEAEEKKQKMLDILTGAD